MARQNRGKKILGREDFKDIKLALETSSVATTALAFGYSETTIRRVKRSHTFSEYKGYIAASNGSNVFNENEFQRELEEIKSAPSDHYLASYVNDYPVESSESRPRWAVVILILGALIAIGLLAVVVMAIF